jgi:lysophospholipid acyltransferase (LPLAT)-like uncharacterized protein
MRLDSPAAIARQERTLNIPDDRPAHRLALWRRAAVWPLAALVRLWARTLRVSIPEEDRRIVTLQGRPTIFVLWHNRLLIAADLARRFRGGHPMCGLISASRDGGWLSAFYASAGVKPVRGSSSRLGREAANALIEELRAGHDVGITPDGPRGPVYEMKPGAIIVARRSGSRLILAGIDYESSWRLPSWDGFHLPMPFSRVHLRIVEVGAAEMDDRDQAARLLGARMVEINPDRKPAPVRKRA